MARLHTSFILGYHGCTADIGEKVLSGELTLEDSDKSYDWLGPGIYFWESDPKRAWEWANAKVAREKSGTACVVGAVIDLGNCLDLMSQESLKFLSASYDSFTETHRNAEFDSPLPTNRATGTEDTDDLLRYLDCAVIKHLHAAVDAEEGLEPFDTVRGLFTEGEPLYEGSGFKKKTHIQIAVRSSDCLKGFFRVHPE